MLGEERSGRHSVFVVEDHPITSQGLVYLLREQPDLYVCGTASSVQEALSAIPSAAPDVVVVDITLNAENGLELVRELSRALPGVKQIVLSMHDETLYAERALRAGASGYVMKNASSRVLLEAIRTVLRGRIHISDAMRDLLLEANFWLGGEPDVSPLKGLSDRELEVFRLLGQGWTTREIAGQMQISPQTVSTYRERIKHKLGISNATELLRRAVAWVERG